MNQKRMPRHFTQAPAGTVRQADLRRALGQFATGVVVVTAWDEARRERLGMTMNSFSSVSLDPPLVLFSISRHARGLPVWRRVPAYGINVLGRDQANISDRFARSLSAKWQDVASRPGPLGTPLLDVALVRLECTAYRQYDGGDHVIFLGRVEHVEHGRPDPPLIFFRGRYTGVQPHADADTECALRPDWPLSMHY